MAYKEIDRPEVAHFLYEYLPLIDEHNKQRQNILNLERCWFTKDPWFRLLTTITGMCVVDCHRWHRHMLYLKQAASEDFNNLQSPSYVGNGQADELQVKIFSDILCATLETPFVLQKRIVTRNKHPDNGLEGYLSQVERIQKNGTTTRDATKKTTKRTPCRICTCYELLYL